MTTALTSEQVAELRALLDGPNNLSHARKSELALNALPGLLDECERLRAEVERGNQANIQWKNTDACIDWHCCGPESSRYEHHEDGTTFGQLTCPTCGSVWLLPFAVTLTREDA